MPSSVAGPIPYVINYIYSMHPTSILDIGVGFGKYGYLFREYLDIWAVDYSANVERFDGYTNWKTIIHGIEGYAPYITDLQRLVYNEIFIGDAKEILPALGQYDLIFMGDVIEHFTKEDGHFMIVESMKHASALLMITPSYSSGQTNIANPFDNHRSGWGQEDITRYSNSSCKTINDFNMIEIHK